MLLDLYRQLEEVFEKRDAITFGRLLREFRKASKQRSAAFAAILNLPEYKLTKEIYLGKVKSWDVTGELLPTLKRMAANGGVAGNPLHKHHIAILAALPEDDPFVLGDYLEMLQAFERKLGFALSHEAGIALLEQSTLPVGKE